MDKQRIAIIGLGRISSAFLKQMLLKHANRIELVCVAEAMDTTGKQDAIKAGVTLKTLDEIIALGDQVDVIFDLTGNVEVRKELRSKIMATKNMHTVIASESIVRVIWALMSDDELPVIAGRVTGY